MCIYTVKKQFFFKNEKILQGGCATPLNVPKFGVSGVKDTAKTNKDYFQKYLKLLKKFLVF